VSDRPLATGCPFGAPKRGSTKPGYHI